MTFVQALAAGRPLLMDGALGTELRRAGLPEGSCGEVWNLTRPDKVRAVHEAYAAAGAEVLLSNTFQANPVALARHALEERLEEINAAAVRLARRAAGPHRFVLGSVGPILEPDRPEFAERQALHRVLASLEGVDGILFETCSSPAALAAVEYALHRVGEIEGLPLLLSLTYHRDPAGRLVTLSGHAPETYARHAQRHGAAALGVNCGRDMGLGEVVEVVRRYRAVTDLPLFARPNAGTPWRGEGGWTYPLGPEALAAGLPELLRAGATLVGGCCGTTPAHVAGLARALAGG
jgi:5-methyltetrahydrofolate--homocysteine methyltransferase